MRKTLDTKEQKAYDKLNKVMDALYTKDDIFGASFLNDFWINFFNLFVLLEDDNATEEDIIKNIDLMYNNLFKGRA